MRTSQMIVIAATSTGWPLEYIKGLSYRRLAYIVNQVCYQRRSESYRIEYRIGQVICTLASDKTNKYKPEQLVGEQPKQAEVTINMTETAKVQSVVLGDGKAYQFPVIDANIMEAVEDEFDKEWDTLFSPMRAKVLKSLVFYMLKRENPDITREDVGKLLTVKVLENVTTAISKMV